jgi:hypothetical protein
LTAGRAENLGSCPSRARSHGDSRESPAMVDRNSLIVNENASPAHTGLRSTPLHGGTPASSGCAIRSGTCPRLSLAPCRLGGHANTRLWLLLAQASRALPGPGTASEMRTVGAVVISSPHAETAARPRVGSKAGRRTLLPTPRPSRVTPAPQDTPSQPRRRCLRLGGSKTSGGRVVSLALQSG